LHWAGGLFVQRTKLAYSPGVGGATAGLAVVADAQWDTKRLWRGPCHRWRPPRRTLLGKRIQERRRRQSLRRPPKKQAAATKSKATATAKAARFDETEPAATKSTANSKSTAPEPAGRRRYERRRQSQTQRQRQKQRQKRPAGAGRYKVKSDCLERLSRSPCGALELHRFCYYVAVLQG